MDLIKSNINLYKNGEKGLRKKNIIPRQLDAGTMEFGNCSTAMQIVGFAVSSIR
jgi:hypothetical protein